MSLKFEMVFIFLIVFSSCCFASQNIDYTKYQSMILTYGISSEMNTKVTGNDPKILEAEAKVKLFPREEMGSQKLLNFELISDPDAETDKNDVLSFIWTNVKTDKLTYGFNSKIEVMNRFVKISREIKWPYKFSDSSLDKYISASEFIDIDEDIANTAREVVGNETDYYIVVNKIATWVKENINYNMNSFTEKSVQKSSWVLANKQGVCDELSNLFISMIRSLGIPARFVSGTAYTNTINDWGNHGWSEVYFPGYGWASYDVTYGQFGWVDPSHLELSDTVDSGESSVDYKWRTRDEDIEVKDILIKTDKVNFGDLMDKQVSLEVKPIYSEVGFGSFVPVQVTVTNLKDYYISESIFLVKAPKMLDTVSKIIWLKPGETKSFYWTVEIPKDLDPTYVFSAVLEAEASFGEKADSSILIDSKAKVYAYENIAEKVYNLEQRTEKNLFDDSLNVDCYPAKSAYYSNEKIDVTCKIINKYSSGLGLKACLADDCKEANLGVGEVKFVELSGKGVGRKTVVVESENMIKYFDVNVEIIEVPDIYLSDFSFKEIDYNEKKNLVFRLNSDFTAYNVNLIINGKYSVDFEKFKGEQTVSIEVYGKDLVNGLNTVMSYKDVKGKIYTKDETYFIDILNIPWWKKLFMLIGL